MAMGLERDGISRPLKKATWPRGLTKYHASPFPFDWTLFQQAANSQRAAWAVAITSRNAGTNFIR